MDGLTTDEIATFVRDGYLVLRGCFARDAAEAMVRATFVDADPAPELFVRTAEGIRPLPSAGIDLADPSTWPTDRIDLSTQRSLETRAFAPRLWAAIETLCGPGRWIRRTTMGEKWILNGRMLPPPAPPYDAAYVSQLDWHIDAPGERTTLDERHDALVVLVLWSDVDPGGAGTLYSSGSLTGIVRAIEGADGGLDTRSHDWAREMVARCDDAVEATGRIGDVVVCHGLMLHAAHGNYGSRVRILENTTYTVAEPLDYHSDNPDPSPVERAVLRRLSRPRPSPTRTVSPQARSAAFVAAFPRAFLPDSKGTTRASPADARTCRELDLELADAWTEREATRIHRTRGGDIVAIARDAVATVRSVLLDPRAVPAHFGESIDDDDFDARTFRRLVRGLCGDEGRNHLVARLLAHVHDDVVPFALSDPATGERTHVVVRVRAPEGTFFVDASATEAALSVPAPGEQPHPGARAYAAAHPDRVRPRTHFEHGRALRSVARSRPARATVELPAGGGAEDAWGAYLRARVVHVWQDARAALPLYRACRERFRLGGLTGAVVDAFIAQASEATT